MNKEKNIKIIIIAVLTIFVLLAAVFLLKLFIGGKNFSVKTDKEKNLIVENNLPDKIKSPATTTPIVEKVRDIGKFKELAAKNVETSKIKVPETIADVMKNVDGCAEIKVVWDKDVCVTLWAEYEKNLGICEKASEKAKQACQDRVLIAKAVSEKNISLCANTKSVDAKWTCISKMAEKYNFSDKDCAVLPSVETKLCLLKVSTITAKSAEDCNNIVDASVKRFCRNNFYAELPKK